MIETLEGGRDAMRRHAWTEAIEALTAVDHDGGLAPADLELLGAAMWWTGHPDEATEALERSFAAYVSDGRSIEAAGVALTLAYEAFRGLAGPVAGGWLARAERLLEGEPESPMHAWLGVFHALGALMATRLDEGIELADQAIDVARRQDNPNAMYQAMSFKGMAELFKGNLSAGQALIDEAAAAASSGQLDLRTASDIYCNTISACRNVGDLARASQWAAEGERFMHREAVGGYPGDLPDPSRRDEDASWPVVGGGARGASGRRGALALPAPGCRGVRALSGRRGPASDGRPRQGG